MENDKGTVEVGLAWGRVKGTGVFLGRCLCPLVPDRLRGLAKTMKVAFESFHQPIQARIVKAALAMLASFKREAFWFELISDGTIT